MAKGIEIPLATAAAVAERLLTLRPLTERMELAGSLRRCKPVVHDIDLVVIAKEPPFMQQNPFEWALNELAEAGTLKTAADKIWKAVVGGVPVDVYFATPETWTTIFFMRTGSAAHNIAVAQRAIQLGMRWHADGTGLERADGTRVVVADEEDLFRVLQWSYKVPQARD